MPTRRPFSFAGSGRDRYLLLDCLNKRIATLRFRALQRVSQNEAPREDLEGLELELIELRNRIERTPS